MTFLKQLRVLTAVLTAAAATAAVTTSLFGDIRGGSGPSDPGLRPDGGRMIDELAVTKFSQLPAITYQVRDGDTLFAWQVKPQLEAAPARPRDVLVLVDTSASQAGKPLQQARQILTALATSLTKDDRISVWSVSTPAATKPLTRDFQPADSDDVRAAAAALTEIEYGSGATDLKNALDKALKTVRPNRGRHQVLLFLGDGESAFDPLSEADRVAFGSRMDQGDVYFFAVPLGVKVHANNLHGLAALTGGSVVRLVEDLTGPAKRAEFVARLKAAFDAPVLKADKYAFGPEVAEVYPTKLPPLRADKSTLVLGKLANPAQAVRATVTGKVAHRPVSVTLTQPLPPSQPDHFFLNLMLAQWRDAPHKDAPAVLQADRALALASTQVKLYKDEFLTQAAWAIRLDRPDEASNLYAAARRIDPNDPEAVRGLKLAEQMKGGQVTKAELERRLAAKAEALKVDRGAVVRTVVEHVGQEPAQPPAAQPPPGAEPPPAAGDLLREAATRRRIEEERYRVLVDATIRRARQLLRVDPDGAYQDLKRQRDDVAAYEAISDPARARLVADLEAVMREIFVKGAEIKRQAAAEREQIARARQRLNEFDRVQAEEDRTKARIDAFKQLMQQARFELAYQEAQLMIQERIARGQSVPNTAVASYIIGQQATHLREWRELVRLREDRFLLSMMQTEKSHIPYPDEPPVHFPPAAVWRELTGLRRERYMDFNLGPEPSPTQRKLQSIIETQRVSYEGNLNEVPLFELLQNLAKRYDVTFIIMEDYFRADGEPNIREKRPNLAATRLEGMTMGNFLDIILQSMNATYIVRPDYIEITTFARRLEEKVTRVFPVADLVVPIPNAVVQSQLIQNLTIQNAQLAIFGQASLFGGGLQQLGGYIGVGGAGGFGMNPLLQGGGQQGMMFGNLGAGGQAQNLGVGGGIAGTTGGNLGQFGNLGGQFGLQGGDQSALLLQLIFETVARGEWANIQQQQQQQPGGMVELETPLLTAKQLNSLGYYPPARALIVRGTARYHSAASIKLQKAGEMAAAPNPPRGPVVIGPNTGPVAPVDRNAANPGGVAAKPAPAAPPATAPKTEVAVTAPAGETGKPGIVDPKVRVEVLRKRIDNDPRRMWHQAIDWTVTDPGLIVASAEFLMEFDEYAHAAEVLKANLRKGLATDDWAHEALAIALQMGQAAPAEVERAAVSAIDLDPSSPKAYLKAAKVEADLGNHDLAVAFCKRAARFAPNEPEPYANALAYAEKAKAVTSDTVDWAAGNLLRRDWPADGVDYHQKVRELLPRFVTRFETAGAKADTLRRTLTEQTQRDLVIELVWQGPADLDLTVTEPSGSVCSPTKRRTAGGGVLRADQLDQRDDPNAGGGRSEVYTAASAFSGTYKVTVRKAFGQPVGNAATLKVYRFKGTPKESFDLIPVDLAGGRPIEFKLDGGSRTELAAVYEEPTEFKLETTGSPATRGSSGMGGGVGSAGSAMTTPVGGTNAHDAALPVVVPPVEVREPGIGGTADLRASFKLNPDRQSYSVRVDPVFATAGGRDVPLPKVPLLPGGEQ